jgi:hypothetical protein
MAAYFINKARCFQAAHAFAIEQQLNQYIETKIIENGVEYEFDSFDQLLTTYTNTNMIIVAVILYSRVKKTGEETEEDEEAIRVDLGAEVHS